MAQIKKMNIQLSPTKIVRDALTVWNESGPEVDLTMDLKNLTFKPGSVDEICAFHVLDHLFPNEIIPTLLNWKKLLKVGGKLFVVVDDFEYISRAFVGGDISIEIVNEMHSHPTQFSRSHLVNLLREAGFKEDKINIWLAEQVADNKFPKEHYELVLESIHHE